MHFQRSVPHFTRQIKRVLRLYRTITDSDPFFVCFAGYWKRPGIGSRGEIRMSSSSSSSSKSSSSTPRPVQGIGSNSSSIKSSSTPLLAQREFDLDSAQTKEGQAPSPLASDAGAHGAHAAHGAHGAHGAHAAACNGYMLCFSALPYIPLPCSKCYAVLYS